ncbi:LysR family transcriptional regulator [Bordetella genomosp. 11]|uniref:LysR family transcriptional regulator n=1 Tax=Bordetella genomosp. 11 TaxID=1416808 RepID=A0A261ULQ9_9BORD|nr:LysR family transcriptional regulator [Bordetella genomosp. 11]OZI62312.1 LysR family transcriptional regulator [Bordetella genomosp. 11]
MLDIKPLRYFVTLAETRHFGRAAARLHLSQPPLSRQLASLEAALGVKLLERNPRMVALTPAGERFLVDAKAILAAVEQAGRNAQAAARGDAGALSIGFTMYAAYSVIPTYAKAYGSAYPEVALKLREVVSQDLAAQVLDGRIDAAVVMAGGHFGELSNRVVVREPLCVALSRGHPRARSRRPMRIGQLAGEPFIMTSSEVGPALRANIVEHCRQAGFEPIVRLEVQLQQTVLNMVDEGVGVALVPSSMRKSRLPGVAFRPLANAPHSELVLLWSPRNRNPCLSNFLALATPA